MSADTISFDRIQEIAERQGFGPTLDAAIVAGHHDRRRELLARLDVAMHAVIDRALDREMLPPLPPTSPLAGWPFV